MKVHVGVYLLILYMIPVESKITYDSGQVPSFFTSEGKTMNVDSCDVVACTKCPTGSYNLGCGHDDARIAPNNCQNCTSAKPGNSSYAAFPGKAGGFFAVNDTVVCPWVCNNLFVPNAQVTACDLTACTKPLPANSEYKPGATPLDACPHICSAGYFGSSVENPTSCTGCSAGSYAVAGTSTCTKCATGKYSSKTNSEANGIAICTSCSPGTYAANEGSGVCSSCASGTYHGGFGLTSNTCASCPGGTYSSTGAAQCTACPVGKYIFEMGSTSIDSCTNCTPGTYSESTTGVGSCAKCPLGTASTVTGSKTQTDCAICVAGKYAQSTGQSECTNCSIGFYQDENGAANCKTCIDAVSYANVPGLQACISCKKCTTGLWRNGCTKTSEGTCTGCTSRVITVGGETPPTGGATPPPSAAI